MAAKSWKERLNLSVFTDETQEEFLRARRRRGFSRPLIFVVVIVAAVFFLAASSCPREVKGALSVK